MPDLAIIVPTRGRPENIQKVIAAWDFTNAWDHADLILAVDADDPEIGGYLKLVTAIDLGVKTLSVPTWIPMVHKLDAAARDAAPDYFAIGFAGDDHLPQTIGWAERYLTVLRELGTGMVYGDDGYQGAKLSTEWAVTADAVRALGRMVPAPVEHMYCDNSMMDLYGGAGALRHLPEVRIEHMHPIAGKAESDDQYKRVNHRDQFSRDRQAYQRWERTERDSQIEIIRSLRQGLPDVPSPAKIRSQQMTAASRARRTVARSGPSQRRADVARFPFSREFKNVRGATPDEIGMALADLASQVPFDQEIVELGVFQGRTALIMAWGARQGQGAHVTGIDPWDLPGNVYDPPFTDAESKAWAEYRIRELGYGDSITLIQAFSHNVADLWRNPLISAIYVDQPVGLLYVDGDHTKEGARRDIEAWAPHLAPGAVIAVDDYGHPDWPGVGEAVDELVAEGFLEPFQLYHDRLAVTRLAGETPEQSAAIVDSNLLAMGSEGLTEPPLKKLAPGIYSITGEGVAPSPYPAVDDQVADGPAAVPEKTAPAPIKIDSEESEDLTKLSMGELRARVRKLDINPKGMDQAALIAAIQVAE